jgi:hypothetical protein
MMRADDPRPVVLCPLEFECRALQRAGVDRTFALACCGPGPDAVSQWLRNAGRGDRAVILAGLAGALVDALAPGAACVITEVIDAPSGRRWRPPLQAIALDLTASPCAVTSTPHSICTPSGKRSLHHRTGAHVVDLESVAFAHAASDLHRPWGIVRGISDGVDDALPDEVDGWVDSTGRTRLRAVMASILRRASTPRQLLDLRARASRAMARVALLLNSVDGPRGPRA